MTDVIDPGVAMSTAITTSMTSMANMLVSLITALLPVALVLLIAYLAYRWISSGKAKRDVKNASR